MSSNNNTTSGANDDVIVENNFRSDAAADRSRDDRFPVPVTSSDPGMTSLIDNRFLGVGYEPTGADAGVISRRQLHLMENAGKYATHNGMDSPDRGVLQHQQLVNGTYHQIADTPRGHDNGLILSDSCRIPTSVDPLPDLVVNQQGSGTLSASTRPLYLPDQLSYQV